jgi:hypothetical protein
MLPTGHGYGNRRDVEKLRELKDAISDVLRDADVPVT